MRPHAPRRSDWAAPASGSMPRRTAPARVQAQGETLAINYQQTGQLLSTFTHSSNCVPGVRFIGSGLVGTVQGHGSNEMPLYSHKPPDMNCRGNSAAVDAAVEVVLAATPGSKVTKTLRLNGSTPDRPCAGTRPFIFLLSQNLKGELFAVESNEVLTAGYPPWDDYSKTCLSTYCGKDVLESLLSFECFYSLRFDIVAFT